MMNDKTDLINITVADGKYTIRQISAGKWECLRYGEHWPGMVAGPDNLHVALAYEIDRLRTITDEAVERACVGYWGAEWETMKKFPKTGPAIRASMRRALEAAMGEQP